MINLGTVRPGSTIYIPFDTFAGSTGAPITLTGLATSDILVYKDGGTTERASASGFTLLDTDGIDFDAKTGIHGVSISLADNTTAGFWAAGSRYFVVIGDVTIDSQTVRFIAATFDIGYPDAVINTTIATLASQTSFTLTSGPAEDDALNGCQVVIHDVASAVQLGLGTVSDYTGATKTVTLAAGTTFTAAATDNISILPRGDVTHVNGVAASGSGTVSADVVSISGDTTAADNLEVAYENGLPFLVGQVHVGAATTTTTFETDTAAITGLADDYINNALITFISGALKGITVRVTDFVTATNVVTTSTMPTAPSNDDWFILMGRQTA